MAESKWVSVGTTLSETLHCSEALMRAGRVLQVLAVAGSHGAHCLGPIGRRLVGGGERSPTAGQIVAEQLRDALAELARPS